MKFFKHTIKVQLRLILAFSFLMIMNTTYCQVKYGFGLRTQFGGMQAFKDVKGYYDDMRPWLSNQMGTSARMVGLEFGLESSAEKVGLAFAHIYGVGSNSTAPGTNNGIDYKRKIKARMWGIETIDAWYTPIKLGNFNFGGGIMPFGLGIFRVSTKLNKEERVKIPLSDLEKNLDVSFLKTSHMYAQFHLDLTRVHKESGVHCTFKSSIHLVQKGI